MDTKYSCKPGSSSNETFSDFLSFFTLPYNCLFFQRWPPAYLRVLLSRHLPLSLLPVALWPFFACTPDGLGAQGHISSLTYVAAANPTVGEEAPCIFACAHAMLVAVSCLVLVPPQVKRAGQSATAFLSASASLPGSFLCRRYPGGLNVALKCGLS